MPIHPSGLTLQISRQTESTPPTTMNQGLKCIVIDDEPLARELIKSYVEKTPGLTLNGCYESAAEAVKSVVAGDADVVFLDIEMPMINGIDFAEVIPPRTRIIYITAYERYAIQGFKVNALDYLLKPVSYPEFMKAVGKAVEWCAMRDRFENASKSSPELFTIKADHRIIQLKTDTILYVEVRKDRVIFYRTEGEPLSSFMSLSELEELLPADKFMRVHRSYIVNLKNIEIVERKRIVFGKTYIPIAESRCEEFFSRLGK